MCSHEKKSNPITQPEYNRDATVSVSLIVMKLMMETPRLSAHHSADAENDSLTGDPLATVAGADPGGGSLGSDERHEPPSEPNNFF